MGLINHIMEAPAAGAPVEQQSPTADGGCKQKGKENEAGRGRRSESAKPMQTHCLQMLRNRKDGGELVVARNRKSDELSGLMPAIPMLTSSKQLYIVCEAFPCNPFCVKHEKSKNENAPASHAHLPGTPKRTK